MPCSYIVKHLIQVVIFYVELSVYIHSLDLEKMPAQSRILGRISIATCEHLGFKTSQSISERRKAQAGLGPQWLQVNFSFKTYNDCMWNFLLTSKLVWSNNRPYIKRRRRFKFLTLQI